MILCNFHKIAYRKLMKMSLKNVDEYVIINSYVQRR